MADYADLCADTASTQTANSDGCALEQLDSDNDGVNDAEEVAEGTDPEDSTSFPPITIETFAASPTNISSKGQQVELRWRVSGHRN
ncbi:thrombospondin type 3 repeat-containing protein [Microbulbifer halophilus]|uniref:thrombospondin type 3 repeat-containing protein n=1 Tax=Microbulbifer halophilus TaxID=453963 RepID=UPI0036200E90